MPEKSDPAQYQLASMYAKNFLRSESWIEKAEDLLGASHLLEEKLVCFWESLSHEVDAAEELAYLGNLQAPYFMLVAFAIENFCKAYLIRKNERDLRNRLFRRLPSYINEHDLARLAKRVDLPLDAPEEELLARLTRCSIWAGRYPVPATPNGMRNIEEFSDGRRYLLCYFSAPDIPRVHKFLERLRLHVDPPSGVAD